MHIFIYRKKKRQADKMRFGLYPPCPVNPRSQFHFWGIRPLGAFLNMESSRRPLHKST